jgi:hypothetical protein
MARRRRSPMTGRWWVLGVCDCKRTCKQHKKKRRTAEKKVLHVGMSSCRNCFSAQVQPAVVRIDVQNIPMICSNIKPELCG